MNTDFIHNLARTLAFICMLIILAGLCISICFNSDTEDSSDGFTLVYKNDKENIFFYKEDRTDVMYALYKKQGFNKGSAGLTVMLAPDGTPLLYSEWIETAVSTEQGG